MRTFAEKSKTVHTRSPGTGTTFHTPLGHGHDMAVFLRSQRRIGNQAAPPVPRIDPDLSGDHPKAAAETWHSGCDSLRMQRYSGTEAGLSNPVDASGESVGGELHRHAAGTAPVIAPPIVREILRGPGRPIPADVLGNMEGLLGQDFSDVRIHTDEPARASARMVAAHAYTVGRHIVFGAGRYDPSSENGRRLLTHELTHVADYPSGVPVPAGDLRISTPAEAVERHAVRISEGAVASAAPHSVPVGLYRQTGSPVDLTGLSVNHRRVTVPPVAGLSFSAIKDPANASGVTLDVVGDNATINAGTTINNSTGAITVAPGQTGGSAHIRADQSATGIWATAPFNFTAIPSGITSTSASQKVSAAMYGGEYIHTFTSPGGGQSALDLTHVNESFPGVNGTTLGLSGDLGNFTITVNDPNSPSAGWDLDSGGDMAGPDHVTWANSTTARPFIVNASNPSPAHTLPQELTATQNFRNLTFPDQTYGNTAVVSTIHRRAFEERNNLIVAVTSANGEEIVQDYVGPTVFRRCSASPNTLPVRCPGGAAVATTSMISVDAEGQSAAPTFSVRRPDLGCTITPDGELTPGTIAGDVTIRAGARSNYDEVIVTISEFSPEVTTFTINNDAPSTSTQTVTLNNTATCSATHSTPTHFMASEDTGFSRASWLTYAVSPSFVMSNGYGVKTVHLKLKNDAGESGVMSDSIEYAESLVEPPSP